MKVRIHRDWADDWLYAAYPMDVGQIPNDRTCDVTIEQARDWERICRAWRLAQAEMRQAWDKAATERSE